MMMKENIKNTAIITNHKLEIYDFLSTHYRFTTYICLRKFVLLVSEIRILWIEVKLDDFDMLT